MWGTYVNEIPRGAMLGLLADLPIPELAAPLLIRKLSQLSLDGKLDDIHEQSFCSPVR